MLIGFDFDNTIVSYDKLFHRVATERALIPADMEANKLTIRNHLRHLNQEDLWTEMQGYVYGERMLEASSFPDALTVLARLKAKGHELMIISHKTQYPFLGKQYDLHAAASAWIKQYLTAPHTQTPLFPDTHIYFEATKAEKISRIKACQCEIFLDDLPEILLAENFPPTTKRYLFDPDNYHALETNSPLVQVNSWEIFENHLS